MKVIIIEDEPPAVEKIRAFLDRYDDSIRVAAQLESVKEIQKWFRANKPPDLIFSDIELLDGNVFEFLETEDVHVPIIFTTAYDQFLLKAFEKNGIAYLLKPFTFENFVAAMLKLEKLKQNFAAAAADTLLAGIKGKNQRTEIQRTLCRQIARRNYFRRNRQYRVFSNTNRAAFRF